VSLVLRFVRALASLPGFRRLTQLDVLLRLSVALRGSLVRRPFRFGLNELKRPHGVSTYVLRGSDVSVAVRHGTPDVLVLDEIFSQCEYDFPSPVLRALEPAGASPRVVDLGANIGLFGAWVLTRFPDASIVAIEADPANAAVHSQTIAANGRARDWKLLQAAAGTSRGAARFAGGGFALSRLANEGEAGTNVPVEDVFDHLGAVNLLKIDIEGAEWAVLADPRFATVQANALVLEYHRELCPGDDPAETAAGFLRDASYELVSGPAKPRFGAGIVWGFRR
jgi:FkbM family methyltransferase